jgi:hypothetical protein
MRRHILIRLADKFIDLAHDGLREDDIRTALRQAKAEIELALERLDEERPKA